MAADGSLYIADPGNKRIQKFTSDGGFVTKWGSYGSNDGQFNEIRGIDVASDGSVYVADGLNHRIQKFSSNGNLSKNGARLVLVTDNSDALMASLRDLMARSTLQTIIDCRDSHPKVCSSVNWEQRVQPTDNSDIRKV